MSYPVPIKQFVTKIDKNASGYYVGPEYFYVPSVPGPYQLYLDHVPRDTSSTHIGPSGLADWTLVTVAPGINQYQLDLDYGKVTFSSLNAGELAQATYYNLGDDIMAEHVNTLQTEVVKIEEALGPIDVRIDASGINGQRLIDNTVRAGALMNDIKGANWVSYGKPTLESNANDLILHKNVAANGHTGTAIAISAPVGTTAATVQEHVDLAGLGFATDRNPHGLSMYDVDGGVLNGSIGANTISAHHLVASGNIMPVSPNTAYASGMYDVGSAAIPWASGNFDTVQAAHFKTGGSDGATGTFTTAGAFTITVRNGLITNIA